MGDSSKLATLPPPDDRSPSWHPDPLEIAHWRWWNGEQWTEETAEQSSGSTPEGESAPSRLEEIKQQIAHLDGASQVLGRKEIKQLPNILWEDENVERIVQGSYNDGFGILVATNKRLIFVDKGIFGLRVEDFPYDKVSSIEYKTGMVFGKITFFASGNKAEITNVNKGQCRNFAEYVRARSSAPTAHASASVSTDHLDQLERLVKLRDAGALTDEEFQAQKTRLLGG